MILEFGAHPDHEDRPEPDPIILCQVCGEEVSETECRHCGGEDGWRSNSEDDGYAWNNCEYCYDGIRYECRSETCKGAERDENGETF